MFCCFPKFCRMVWHCILYHIWINMPGQNMAVDLSQNVVHTCHFLLVSGNRSPLNLKVCPKCGSPFAFDARYCRHCGERREADSWYWWLSTEWFLQEFPAIRRKMKTYLSRIGKVSLWGSVFWSSMVRYQDWVLLPVLMRPRSLQYCIGISSSKRITIVNALNTAHLGPLLERFWWMGTPETFVLCRFMVFTDGSNPFSKRPPRDGCCSIAAAIARTFWDGHVGFLCHETSPLSVKYGYQAANCGLKSLHIRGGY